MSQPSGEEASELNASVLRATLEATADGILVVDLGGRVVVCNERFLSMWAIPPSLVTRLLEEPLLDYVGEQLEDPLEFLRGVRDLYRSERESSDVLRFKDGRVFERCSRPQRVAGVMVGRVWSFHDVTRTEHLLRNAMFLSDATRLLASLDTSEALLGLVRCAVPQLGDHCMADLWNGSAVRRVASASHGGSSPPPLELPRAVRAGRSATYRERGQLHLVIPLTVGGELAGALTFVARPGRQYSPDDLEMATELGRRAALAMENARLFEQARDAIRARDEILSTTAHEIRGPITSIRLATQTLLETEPRESPAAPMLELIERADRRLSRFVDELIDVGRLRTGLMVFEYEDVDLREVIQEVCVRFDPEIARSGSELTLRLSGDLVGEWDRLRIDQIVTNLLSNAIKFGDGRPIRVSAESAGGFATIMVRDHGPGIPPNLFDVVFQPFERAAVSSRREGGLGLGLYIVKAIAVQLGGKVTIESKEGSGTALTVSLPRRRTRR